MATTASAPLFASAVHLRRARPVVFTLEEMTAAIRDLTQVVTGIYMFLARSYGPQLPVPFATAPALQ